MPAVALTMGNDQSLPPSPPDDGPAREQTSGPESTKTTTATRARTGTRAAVQKVRTDVAELREAVETMQEFFFMRNDSQAVHGLQDWTTMHWADELAKHPEPAAKLCDNLFQGDADTSTAQELAERIKLAIVKPLPAKQWSQICEFQNRVLNAAFEAEQQAVIHYMSQPVLSTMMFNAAFPLGVEDGVMRHKYQFAIKNSGLNRKAHKENSAVTLLVYGALLACTLAFFTYMGVMMGWDGYWDLAATVVDKTDPNWSTAMKKRNKHRGTVASLLSAASFSLCINGSLDKFGKIDPSSSTVFIGMVLGGTWGFVLDQIFGSDEGYREYLSTQSPVTARPYQRPSRPAVFVARRYLWSPQDGMKYAMGVLVSERYGRYLVTILFDM